MKLSLKTDSKSISSIITAAVLMLVAVMMFVGGVKVELGDTGIDASATFAGSTTVAYGDITDVALVEGLDIGRRAMGIGSMRLQAGTFQNAVYGTYKLYSYAACQSYVVVSYGNDFLVINGKDDEATARLYDDIQAAAGITE